ncbi:MAG: rod shape-determining protein MreD [Clostridiales bacterium]|jgi:rod shape-determining protein MreD|nr:rod shape-determining protein MreD [Clostridiales bacterium]
MNKRSKYFLLLRILIYFVEVIVFYVLQSSLYRFFNLAGAMPNLLIILVVSSAYMRGWITGMTLGFFSGLLVDILFGNIIGVYAMIMMLIGYLTGFANRIYSKDDFTLPLVFTAVADFLYQFLYYVFEFLLRGKLDFSYYFRKIILPEIIYTVAASILVYKLLHMINHALDRNEFKEE